MYSSAPRLTSIYPAHGKEGDDVILTVADPIGLLSTPNYRLPTGPHADLAVDVVFGKGLDWETSLRFGVGLHPGPGPQSSYNQHGHVMQPNATALEQQHLVYAS
jgi:hypothetical protein